MSITQRDLHQQLRSDLLATRDRIADLLRPLSGAQLNEHPEPKGWSIGQVLEHLIVADELYEEPMRVLMRNARPDAGAAAREWKSTFLGGLIAGSLGKPRPLNAPRVFVPAASPRGGIVETFLARELSMVKQMDDGMAYDWRALRISSPALPRWAPKMNMGDGFRIHTVHVVRHSKQVERLVGKVRG